MQQNKMIKVFRTVSALFILTIMLQGCLKDGSSTFSTPTSVVGGSGGIAPTAVTGILIKGAVNQANITLYTSSANGSIGAKLAGPFRSDANGAWSGTVPTGTTGLVLVQSTGGSYIDEVSKKRVSMGASGLTSVLNLSTGTYTAITPWSHALYLAAKARIPLKSATFDIAISDVINSVKGAGSLGFDPFSTVLSDPAGSQAAASATSKKYAALTAAFSQILQDKSVELATFNNSNPFDLVLALAEDVSNGKLEGFDAGAFTINVATGLGGGTATFALPVLSGLDLSALLTAANNYIANTVELSGVVIDPLMAFNAATQ